MTQSSNTEQTKKFHDFEIHPDILKAIDELGYQTPSPIQANFIPLALTGVDATGQARTGTGKTAAFGIPVLNRINPKDRHIQAIVLTPTRELSEQVAEEFRRLSAHHKCRLVVCVGGRSIGKQITTLRKGVNVVIGTPGRVIDLMRRGDISLKDVNIVVLDEADRMLDIGFRPDIEKILKQCPTERQTLLLSATMPPPVERLAQKYMRDPQKVDLSKDDIAVKSVEQFFVTVDHNKKFQALARILYRERPQQALVFTRTKRGADKLYEKFGKVLPGVELIHGDLPQHKRDRVMKSFREGTVRLLIATDVVGRGIDVSGISHIVNYDIPEFCDDYVHRIGRVGRLSSEEAGHAYTFVAPDQGGELTRIEMRINMLLKEYQFDNFQAHRPKAPRKHVEDHQETPERPEFEFSFV